MSPLIAIIGESASGKSALAMQLAQRCNGELVCADSWTVYKRFDIGTAKPTAAERITIPHHLLDVANPLKGFSVVEFQRLAKQAIEDITRRGKLPILVGGTGLYIDSILYDYQFLPPSDPALRTELNTLNLETLLKRAHDSGLNTAGIDMQNKRRVIRLIENNGQYPTQKPLRQNSLILGIRSEPTLLKQRITDRVSRMIEMGLENEVTQLIDEYGWEIEPMKGIGYREWRQYFDGSQTVIQTQERIIRATLDLAKRQRTWFKRNDSIQWLTDRSKAIEITTTFLNKNT